MVGWEQMRHNRNHHHNNNLHPLCRACPDRRCSGVTVEAAEARWGCLTLFWLVVGELTFEHALAAKRGQNRRMGT